MREIYQITKGEYQGKFCYIVNRLAANFRVCIGTSQDEKMGTYVKIDPNDIDEANPMLTHEILEMLNGKHMEV